MTAQTHLRFSHPATLIATWFGVGLIPFAPGTWGSLAALPFAWALLWAGGPLALLFAALAAFTAGIWASEQFIGDDKKQDPGAVVIDEVAGQWLTLVMASLSWPDFVLGFVFFRLFDIVKPWPANWVDRTVRGGLGIMADDMIAGAYGIVALYAARYWIGLW